MNDRFERHRQPWRPDEVRKLHMLSKTGLALKALAKAATCNGAAARERASIDGPSIAKIH